MARERRRPARALQALAAALFWGLAWHIAATLANRGLMLKIPLPLDTLRAFWVNLGRAAFWQATAASLLHILAGYAAAALLGLVFALLAARFRVFDGLLAPLMHLARTVPVASFIFVAWLWIAPDILPSVIAALMVLPIVYSHVRAGLAAEDVRLVEMARVYGMRPFEILRRVRLPLLLPHLRAGCITGLGIAWKAGVAAEIICNPSGTIGALLQKGKAAIEYEEVFAVTLAVVLLSLAMENLLRLVWKEAPHVKSDAHRS